MKKYNFMGKDTHEEEFWRLCSLTSLEEIEKEVYGAIDQIKVEIAISQFRTTQQKRLNTPKCDSCGSQMILNNAKWGKYWHCSDMINCVCIKLV